ncbi:MAG TPA: AAA family ATPase [Acidimicrobiales bacterium]|nr:AAA family ATPase [Acidimicrobiales bacterium]
MTGGGARGAAHGPLRIRLLGGFRVEGIEERALGTRKGRVLLKRLAVAGGRPVPTEELVEAVWGEEPPQRPADQVSVLVSRLRGVIGAERLVRSDAGYTLVADWVDVVELERRASEIEQRLGARETASALAAAHAGLSLASGILLPEEDGAWVDEARPLAARLVARVRLLAAEASLRAGELAAARAAAQAALDHDPYDEAALRVVMRADVTAGRPGAALAAYAAVRHRLSEDLGTDPSAETEDLHGAILRGELKQPAPAPGTGAALALVGRDGEVALLDQLLAQAAGGSSVGAVIEAGAGLGKSALLSAWAGRAAQRALVVSGSCDELGGDLPLQPIVDGVTALLDSLGRLAGAKLLGGESVLLDPLLGRAGVVDEGATSVADATSGRAALFAALAAVLRRAAGARPLVLTVDDLHQAAPGTAEFLTFALRRIPHAMVVAARRPEPGAELPRARRLVLEPLTLDDVVALVGPDRGPALHSRSGGHPLFVRELAAAGGDELPESVVAAVGAQLARLGPGAATVEGAAVCGTEVDAELVAAVTGRPLSTVLDDLEAATGAGVLRPRGAGLAFSHELVREAVEASTSPARRSAAHRAAVAVLSGRPDAEVLALARHARACGDHASAAEALVAAAEQARRRFEASVAEDLLTDAVALHDSVAARLGRGRVRLSRLDLEGARDDAERAIELGAGVHGFELAGWVAYYGRDYDMALRYADEGVARAGDAELRASCLALAGRIRHTRGQLAEGAARLAEGVGIAPPSIRGMVLVWQAMLLAHRGEPDAGAEAARRGLLEPHIAHPFGAGHGRFGLAYALGVAGRWNEALDAVDALDALVARQDDRRFPPVAANIRGWLLRGAGLLDAAQELHARAADMAPGPTFREAHYAALLDLAECALAAGQWGGAGEALAACADIGEWRGSMDWRHRTRYRLLCARLASLSGDHGEPAEEARAISAEEAARGHRRYALRAELVAAAIDGRAGRAAESEALGQLVERFLPLSGPDGWRDLADLAAAARSDALWAYAEKHAAAVVAEATSRPGFDGSRVAGAVRAQLDALRP